MTKEKIVFSSFHQSKGLERKVVIVMNFSTAFYFIFKDAPVEICPNLVYVAASRSSQILYVWGESEKEQPFPFLKHALLKNNKNFEKIEITSKTVYNSFSTPKEYNGMDLRSVTGLTKFLPEESMQQIIELCSVVTRKVPMKSVNIPGTIATTGNQKENVSDLNGIAIPTIFEHRKTEYISIQTDLETVYLPQLQKSHTGTVSDEQKKWIQVIQQEPKTPSDYLKMANIYSSYMSGYTHKIAQIQDYSWLTSNHVEQLLQILEANVHGDPNDMYFEETLELIGYKFNTREVQIQGRADLIDDETLWELKCVDSLKDEHIVQLALYAYIWQTTRYEEKGSRRFCLLNIRTGEVQEITGIQNLKMILDIVLDNAFRVTHKISDEEFVEMCLKNTNPDFTRPNPPRKTEEECLILDD